jgi:two-component system nitrogen regulation response regulator GlnG
MTARVLVADDDASYRRVLGTSLRLGGFDVVEAADARTAADLLRRDDFDVAVLDVRMPGGNGLDVLDIARARGKPAQVIVITAENTMENAIAAMKRGAFEYLTKPFDLDDFEEIVRRAAADRGPARAEPQPEAGDGDRVLFGRSPAMQGVYKQIGRAARSPHAVLILGESGTGKELVARILHRQSERAGGPFVAVNTAAIPGELLESTLFGHVRGAFTGATEAKPGKFQAADGGTLFLDEVGEMPLPLQAKLLRVLQEKEFHPVGASRQVRVDVRIVAATHRDLARDAEAGTFRADLFYRLDVLSIVLPPLRERRDDIPALAAWLLDLHARQGDIPRVRLTPEAEAALVSRPWPGNVRELENALLRAATFAQGGALRAEDFDDRRGREAVGDGWEARVAGWLDRSEHPYRDAVEDTERAVIIAALRRTAGNQIRAAELLSMNRNTLKRRLDELGIDPRPYRGGA